MDGSNVGLICMSIAIEVDLVIAYQFQIFKGDQESIVYVHWIGGYSPLDFGNRGEQRPFLNRPAKFSRVCVVPVGRRLLHCFANPPL
jgi:hypothetical protein